MDRPRPDQPDHRHHLCFICWRLGRMARTSLCELCIHHCGGSWTLLITAWADSMISSALTHGFTVCNTSHSTWYSTQRVPRLFLAPLTLDCCHWHYPYTPWIFPLVPLQFHDYPHFRSFQVYLLVFETEGNMCPHTNLTLKISKLSVHLGNMQVTLSTKFPIETCLLWVALKVCWYLGCHIINPSLNSVY